MWTLSNRTYSSRLIPGVSHFAETEVTLEALEAAGAELVVVNARDIPSRSMHELQWPRMIQESGMDILPSVSGCQTAAEAINLAVEARNHFDTTWIQLDMIRDIAAVVAATHELTRQDFVVCTSTTDDLVTAQQLVQAGSQILMPKGAGIVHRLALKNLRSYLPDITMILDGGIDRPSEAALVMEWGLDGVIVHDAIMKARDPIAMAEAFADAVVAGHMGFEAGLDQGPAPNGITPGSGFWDLV